MYFLTFVIFPCDDTLNLYESSNVLYLEIKIHRHEHVTSIQLCKYLHPALHMQVKRVHSTCGIHSHPVCFACCMPPITPHLFVCYHMHTNAWVCAGIFKMQMVLL